VVGVPLTRRPPAISLAVPTPEELVKLREEGDRKNREMWEEHARKCAERKQAEAKAAAAEPVQPVPIAA
jgi:hypothetical protein